MAGLFAQFNKLSQPWNLERLYLNTLKLLLTYTPQWISQGVNYWNLYDAEYNNEGELRH